MPLPLLCRMTGQHMWHGTGQGTKTVTRKCAQGSLERGMKAM